MNLTKKVDKYTWFWLYTSDREHGHGPNNRRYTGCQEGGDVWPDRVVDVSGHGGAQGQGHGAEGQQEPDGLARPRSSTQVKRDGSEHGDEAAVEYTKNETEAQHRLRVEHGQ